MAAISGVARPAYVYDAANNQWVPIGVGPHTHNIADLPSVVSTTGGSTIAVTQPTVVGLRTNLFNSQSVGAAAYEVYGDTGELRFRIDNTGGMLSQSYSSDSGFGLAGLNINRFGSDPVGAMGLRGAAGTITAPTVVSSGMRVGLIAASGHDGTDFRSSSRITFYVDGAVAANSVPGAIGFNTVKVGQTSHVERFRIANSGDVQLGTAHTEDTLRYFDISNTHPGANAGGIIRFITNNATNSAVTTLDMVKYRNGNFVINNNDNTGNAHLFYNIAGSNAFVVNPAGNMGIRLNAQTSPTPGNEMSLEVNSTGAQGTAWFKNFGGTRAAPNEIADWPWPTVAITTASNFYLATMLRFSLPNDNLWQTDDSTWNFKLNGTTVSGWDNNSNGTLKIVSDADLGLQLLGPGNLRIGTQGSRSILFRTSGQDNARVDPNGYMLLGYTASNGAYRLQVNSQIFATSSSIATSDGRYKKDVEELTGGLAMVKALRPVEFNWKPQQDIVVDEKIVREAHSFPEGKTVGFIAQEVQEALADQPWVNNLIKENSREAILDAEGNELAPKEEFLGIAETNLIAVLVSAVKELTAKVEALEAKLAE
jgi:hypothetical protein